MPDPRGPIHVCRLVSWSVGQSVSQSVGQLVSWSVGQSVSWSVGQLVSWPVGQLVSQSVSEYCRVSGVNYLLLLCGSQVATLFSLNRPFLLMDIFILVIFLILPHSVLFSCWRPWADGDPCSL